jgi:hypothetical protein
MRRKEPIQEFSVHEVTASDLPLFFYAGVCKTLEHQVFFFLFFLINYFRGTNEEINWEDWSISLIHKSVSVDCGGEVA